MGESASPGGFCLFQPQHSCEQRRWLLNVPRRRESDAADFSGEHAADAMVPRLPSQSGSGFAREARRRVWHELESSGESGRNRQETSAGTENSIDHRADKLLDVSSLIDEMSDHDHKYDVLNSGFVSTNSEALDNHPPTAEER